MDETKRRQETNQKNNDSISFLPALVGLTELIATNKHQNFNNNSNLPSKMDIQIA